MSLIDIAKKVIEIEISGLNQMSSNIDIDFDNAVYSILETRGRTIICGMGKSGIIGKKIAASLASTGTPSFFMHPGEAFHGDLGMVTPHDVFIAISNSGETDEVLKILPFLRDNKNIIIAITSNPLSTLAQSSRFHLNINIPKEACHLQLAPTTSTTATLVMGDALTVALMKKRDFKEESFARFHPGGSLGRRLLGKVKDEMITERLPYISLNDTLLKVIDVISTSGLGIALVIKNKIVHAIITDGDLRRAIEKFKKEIFELTAKDICTLKPLAISPEASIQKAYELMEDRKVNSIVVVKNSKCLGILKK